MTTLRLKQAVDRRLKRLRVAVSMPAKYLYAWSLLPREELNLTDFLIIGAQKAGTTWLKENLDNHPELFLPERDGDGGGGFDPTELRYFDQQFHRPISHYASYFGQSGQMVKGEKTPTYCMLPPARIRFIRELLPDVRLILLMRNPVERAWSHALMNLVKLPGRRFDTVNEKEFYDHFDRARSRGDYVKMLENWLSFFSRDQHFVGFYKDVVSRTRVLLRKVFAYLGVSEDVNWDEFSITQRINKGPGIPITDAYRAYLAQMYEDDIERLHARFGERVDQWRGSARG